MITGHAIDRNEMWGVDAESVIDALAYPGKVVSGYRSRYIDPKIGGTYADKIFA
ncbi:hypothetical protein C5S31_09915 [ANME-1 cluster archaeon GoMg2]|nr:hypothetical protein [ANME-1 cluster archaeon GoMg2]